MSRRKKDQATALNGLQELFTKSKWTPKKVAAIVIAIVVLLFGSNPEVQEALDVFTGLSKDWTEITTAGSKTSPDGVEQGTIDRVVDGDTIKLTDGRTVRLLYVDTPETKKPNTPIQCYGPEATAFTKAFTGADVELVADKEAQDRYQRDLRVVYLEGSDTSDVTQSINAKLVDNGFARVKIYSPNKKYEDELRAIEAEAKQEEKGAWRACENPFEE